MSERPRDGAPTVIAFDPRPDLASLARRFYQRGWMVGTAGNLSARLADGSFWITASGCAKGELEARDFLRVDGGGAVLERGRPEQRPSAETSIHRSVYARLPQATACFHVHSIEANLVARLCDGDALVLPPLEMLKGFQLWQENPRVTVAVLPNHLEVPRIAAELEQRLEVPGPVPGFLIRDHGLTAWGASLTEAFHHVELFDYIFRFMVAARAAGIPLP